MARVESKQKKNPKINSHRFPKKSEYKFNLIKWNNLSFSSKSLKKDIKLNSISFNFEFDLHEIASWSREHFVVNLSQIKQTFNDTQKINYHTDDDMKSWPVWDGEKSVLSSFFLCLIGSIWISEILICCLFWMIISPYWQVVFLMVCWGR